MRRCLPVAACLAALLVLPLPARGAAPAPAARGSAAAPALFAKAEESFAALRANAQAQRQRQNYIRVLDDYRRVFEKYPATRQGEESLMRAGELMTLLFRWTGQEGDLNQARNYYQRLIQTSPKSPLVDERSWRSPTSTLTSSRTRRRPGCVFATSRSSRRRRQGRRGKRSSSGSRLRRGGQASRPPPPTALLPGAAPPQPVSRALPRSDHRTPPPAVIAMPRRRVNAMPPPAASLPVAGPPAAGQSGGAQPRPRHPPLVEPRVFARRHRSRPEDQLLLQPPRGPLRERQAAAAVHRSVQLDRRGAALQADPA